MQGKMASYPISLKILPGGIMYDWGLSASLLQSLFLKPGTDLADSALFMRIS